MSFPCYFAGILFLTLGIYDTQVGDKTRATAFFVIAALTAIPGGDLSLSFPSFQAVWLLPEVLIVCLGRDYHEFEIEIEILNGNVEMEMN